MAAMLLNAKNGTQTKFLVMDYLKHNKALCLPQKIKSFDPVSAFILNKTAQVPKMLLRLAQNDYYSRNGFIKENKLKVSETGEFEFSENDECVFLTLALNNTNLVLSKLDTKTIVFYCNDCHLSFSVLHEDVKAIWTEHLLSELHWNRMLTIEQKALPLMCLQDEPSKIQPAPIEQEIVRFYNAVF